MGDNGCVWKPLCKMNHLFTDDKCEDCTNKETQWDYVFARKGGNNMSENRCVCCGAIIPEGTQVCPNCEKKSYFHRETPEERFDRIMNDWVYPVGIVVLIIAIYFLVR